MEKTKLHRVVWIAAGVAVLAFAAAALVGVLGGLFGPIGGAGWAGRGIAVDRQEALPVAGVERIAVRAVSSRVAVADSVDDRVTARLAGTVRAGREDLVPRLVVEGQGADMRITVEHPTGAMMFYSGDLMLTVGIPRAYAGRLTVSTVSGQIAVADHEYATLAVRTTSGDVQVGAVKTGSLTMGSVSGKLRARAAAAPVVELGSTSGEIAVEGLTGEVRARTVSGSIALAWASFAGTADIGSTSGEVDLRLPAGSAFRLDAASTSGDVRCEQPITLASAAGAAGSGSRRGGHALVGDVGAGGSPVRVRTVSGEIRIRS